MIRVLIYYRSFDIQGTIDDDESDEEDLAKMDMGRKGQPYARTISCDSDETSLKRWDFETQEEFEQYNATREAIPKYILFLFIISCTDY